MQTESNLVVKTLKILGFSASEIAVYNVLIENDYLIVSDISKLSSVPRTKTYDILTKLELKEVIQKKDGHPIKYRAKDPIQTLSKLQKTIINETEQGLDLLKESWSQRESIDDLRPIAIYYGSINYYKVLKKLENDIKSNLFILLTFIISEEEIHLLKSIIKENNKSGIRVELVVHPDVKKKLDISTLNFLSQNTIFKIAPIPMRLFILDNSEMILQIPSTETKGALNFEDINNVIIRIPDLVNTIEKSIRSSISQVSLHQRIV